MSFFNKKTYVGLIILKIVLAFTATGYIHPDAYFQSPEITNRLVFGEYAFLPSFNEVSDNTTQISEKAWEWQPEFANRSLLPSFLLSGVPFMILKWITHSFNVPGPTGWTLYISIRLYMLVLSLIIDIVMYKLVKNLNLNSMKAIILMNLGWSVLMILQPFSNTLELLCLLMSIYFASKAKSDLDYVQYGMWIGLGCFTRFTFPFFAWPFGVYILMNPQPISANSTRPKTKRLKNVLKNKKPSISMARIIIRSALIFIGLSIVFLTCVTVDSLYFGTIQFDFNPETDTLKSVLIDMYSNPSSIRERLHIGNFTIAPLNNLLYNMDPNNLAIHGTHPRFLHALVNAPLLFGPLYLIAMWTLFKRLYRRTLFSSFWDSCVHLSIVSGILLLSMAPHQEPRFLLPLLIPFVILVLKENYLQRPLTISTFLLYQMLLIFFYGYFHQAGVIPSMIDIQKDITHDKEYHIIYYHTYMPPAFILNVHNPNPLPVQLHDVQSADSLHNLLHFLHSQRPQSIVYCVTPATSSADLQAVDKSLKYRYIPHISTEYLPNIDKEISGQLALEVYILQGL